MLVALPALLTCPSLSLCVCVCEVWGLIIDLALLVVMPMVLGDCRIAKELIKFTDMCAFETTEFVLASMLIACLGVIRAISGYFAAERGAWVAGAVEPSELFCRVSVPIIDTISIFCFEHVQDLASWKMLRATRIN